MRVRAAGETKVRGPVWAPLCLSYGYARRRRGPCGSWLRRRLRLRRPWRVWARLYGMCHCGVVVVGLSRGCEKCAAWRRHKSCIVQHSRKVNTDVTAFFFDNYVVEAYVAFSLRKAVWVTRPASQAQVPTQLVPPSAAMLAGPSPDDTLILRCVLLHAHRCASSLLNYAGCLRTGSLQVRATVEAFCYFSLSLACFASTRQGLRAVKSAPPFSFSSQVDRSRFVTRQFHWCLRHYPVSIAAP